MVAEHGVDSREPRRLQDANPPFVRGKKVRFNEEVEELMEMMALTECWRYQ